MNQETLNDTIVSASQGVQLVKETGEYLSAHEIIVVPLLLMVIIYALKYFFGYNFNKKSVVEFTLEFPVDFGFIGITFVLTYCFLDLNSTIFGRIMILVCIIVAIINSTLRRLAISEYEKENANNFILGLYGIINSSISVLFVYFILNSIQTN